MFDLNTSNLSPTPSWQPGLPTTAPSHFYEGIITELGNVMPSNIPSNYIFLGWAFSANGNVVHSIPANHPATWTIWLYAQWQWIPISIV